ncbi:MAG: cadmium-translocating P-type ATPase [Deltaproteobacteria bacterium]|nr:cadmium-translocating P-type ATPase [Deltaproteobacteria bacterium]
MKPAGLPSRKGIVARGPRRVPAKPLALGELKVIAPVAASDDDDGHDHSNCGHDHGPKKRAPRPPQARAAESGGLALQLALADVLPEETDDRGIFERFAQDLRAHRAITDVHVRRDAGLAEVCIHYDSADLGITQVVELARQHGVRITERYERTTWYVRGLESARSAAALETALRRLPGVLAADVAYAAERLVVEYDTTAITPDALTAAVGSHGYALETPEHGHACSMHAHGSGLAPVLQMPLAIGAGVLLAIGWSLARWASLPAEVPTALYLVALVAAGIFPLHAAWNAIKARQPDVETLMILAGVGAAALGAFFEGAFLLFLFTLGHALEHRAMDRARRSIESLTKLTATTARVRRGDQVQEVALTAIAIGDVIVVRPGDRIPLDGTIRAGQSQIDQATITGESVPVPRGPGEHVFAGTISTDAAIDIEVTGLAGDTLLARIVDMVTEAEAQKSATQRFAQRLEKRFVPIVLLAAGILPVVLIATGTAWQVAILRAVAIVVAASPCALAISTPSAILAAVARAAHGGVLVKGGAHLEALGKVKAIAFDKTGTLTHGRPRVVATTAIDGASDDEVLTTAAGLEALSSHPLALAVLEAAKARGLTPPAGGDLEAVHGKGLRGKIGGELVEVGNRGLFDDVPAAIATAVDALEAAGQTTMIVRRAGKFLGVLGVADTLRPEAKGTIAHLGRLGIHTTVMLSGDNQRVARAIADQVGIREAKAPLLPDGKVAAIRELTDHGGVAMIGDGVNDAPALAAASVGIAMGGTGSDAALETADIVLLGDSLARLPFAVGLARRASRVIRQNVVISLAVSAVLVVASAIGFASIAEAVVLHEGSTLLVVGNALLLLRYPEQA